LQIREDPEALKSYAQNWLAIRDLIHREWFSRLWVFQEIGLAAQGTIIIVHDKHAVVGLLWIWIQRTNVNDSVEEVNIEDFALSNISGFLDIWRRKVVDSWTF
jgi:hypothetical protein